MKTPFENCVWIGGDSQCVSPVLMRKFFIARPRRAELTITGLGYFEAKINGREITDARFLPVVSDYEPRDLTKLAYPIHDHLTNRIYYYKFDVTELLCPGENTLTIQLGNGWYRQNERLCEGKAYFGETLKAIYKLETEDTVLVSDGSESWQESEIRRSSLYYGETADYGAASHELHPVTVLPAPETQLTQAMGTPDRVIRTVQPTVIGCVNGKTVYDAGENISGVVEVETSAPAGSRIVLQFAEEIDDRLELRYESAGSIVEDIFITDGRKRKLAPKFTWHGFRYFTVEGPAESVTVQVIHSAVQVTGCFESSSEGLNFFYDAYLRAQLGNMHGSIPSDCPHRERLGYTGDGQVCAPAAMLILDCRQFYEKWIQDILDCQCQSSGHVQHTAPLMGGGGGPGGWGCAIVMVPYAYYKQYGDLTILQKCYEPMKKWLGYMKSRCEYGLVTHEEGHGWCLGDWCTLGAITIPESYVNTCYYVKALRIMEEIACLLGNAQDILQYVSDRKNAENALIAVFRRNGRFVGGIQGADAYAVWCGIAGADSAWYAAEKYRALGHFDTGFLGTDILLEVLFQYGYADVALSLLESEEPGSFLYMKRRGATTLWENWTGTASHNHPMFGAGVRHLFTGFLGIQQRENTAGWTDVIVRPCRIESLPSISGSIETPQGKISVTVKQGRIKATAPKGIKLELAAGGEIIYA